VVSPAVARAQDSANAAEAQVIYDQATQAMDRKDYAVACPKLEEVVRLVPDGIGARVTLGECYEEAGKLASAWAAFSAAQATAARLNQAARADSAKKAADRLKPRLGSITIEIPPAVRAVPGLLVERDGTTVGPAVWGIRVPVDRGEHKVAVRAPGKVAWTRGVDVKDGAGATVVVEPLTDPTSGAAPPSSVVVAPISPPPASLERPGGRRSIPPLAIAGFVAAGVGVATGTVTGIISLSSGAPCTKAPGCTQSTLDGARTTAWVSDIAFGVAAAGAALGVIAWATAPKSAPSAGASPPSTVTAKLRLGPGAVRFEGTF
jgi:hypothetical protein